jgi:hypothetical protein
MGVRFGKTPTREQILSHYRAVVGALDAEIGADPRWKEEAPEDFLHAFRPDGAKLPPLFEGLPNAGGVLDRLQTVFAHSGPETGHMYFMVSRPAPLTDAELVATVRTWASTVAGLIDAASLVDEADTGTVHALVNAKLAVEIVDGPPGEGSDHPLLAWIHEAMLWYSDQVEYPAFADLLIEPLYMIACRYALVHWILRPSLGPVDDDLFAPRAKLWLAGVEFAFVDEGKNLHIQAWRTVSGKPVAKAKAKPRKR